jgi:hypothetical protein
MDKTKFVDLKDTLCYLDLELIESAVNKKIEDLSKQIMDLETEKDRANIIRTRVITKLGEIL